MGLLAAMDVDTVALADEEWEYEYDPVETETFLIDVDLTSVNRPVMSANATKSKRGLKIIEKPKSQKGARSQTKHNSQQNHSAAATTEAPPNEDDGTVNHENVQSENRTGMSAGQQHEVSDDIDNRLQTLDFHTNNPILSYRGDLYICTWHDMVGTNIFFSKHGNSHASNRAVSTEDFDILGTTRIKLVGNQVTVTPLDEENKNATRNDIKPTDNTTLRPGAGLGDLRTNSPKVNADMRKQANFLEQLMEVKKARGEPDVVRLVANQKIAQASEKGGEYSAAKRRKLDELNKRAVKGDGKAVKQLKTIYSAMDDTNSDIEEDGEEEGQSQQNEASEDVSTPVQRPQRSTRKRLIIEPESSSEDGD